MTRFLSHTQYRRKIIQMISRFGLIKLLIKSSNRLMFDDPLKTLSGTGRRRYSWLGNASE